MGHCMEWPPECIQGQEEKIQEQLQVLLQDTES